MKTQHELNLIQFSGIAELRRRDRRNKLALLVVLLAGVACVVATFAIVFLCR